MSFAYFATVAVMFLAYCTIRAFALNELRWLGRPVDKSSLTGKSIDTDSLAVRVESVRQNYRAEIQSEPSSPNRALLLKTKREQVAQLAFFHRPAPPQPPDEEHGSSTWLLA
ncbi:MAG: hypothetical protein JWR69_288 [Pedosphaera sp.]|nr:hypothetical protein [Pedosphaera sp.]